MMKLFRLKYLALVGVAAAVGLLAPSASYANCGSSAPIATGVVTTPNLVQNCGSNAIGQFWLHRNAIWNAVSGAQTVAQGVDSGASPNPVLEDTTAPGTYSYVADWIAPGVDGCALLANEGPAAPCTGGSDLMPTDIVVAGQVGNGTLAAAFFGSVDLNPLTQNYLLDNLSAAAVGDHCGGDPAEFGPQPYDCVQIAPPSISNISGTGPFTYTISLPPQSIPYLDDCNVAESAAVNCPRNLNAGQVLMVRRGPCSVTPPGVPVNNRVATYVEFGTSSSWTAHWHPYSAADADFNGFTDPGTTTRNAITKVAAGGGSVPITTNLLTPAEATAGVDDCLYVGIAAAGDNGAAAPQTPFLTPYVSMEQHSAIPLCQFICPNGSCAPAAGQPCPQGGSSASNTGATPAGDRVVNVKVTKKFGKTDVSWDTTSELATAGFNLIGTKKNGRDVRLNARLIPAKNGTTGSGASYTMSIPASALKGSTSVYVEIITINGAKERFGPASF
jgi:hypothetical protein